jgi:transaldolase
LWDGNRDTRTYLLAVPLTNERAKLINTLTKNRKKTNFTLVGGNVQNAKFAASQGTH